jgi:hypothetical protein
MRAHFLVLAGALMAAGTATSAQTVAQPRRANVFSIHPSGVETSVGMAFVYERRVSDAVTIGLSSDLGVLGRPHDGSLQSTSIGVRYFFSGDAWRGLSLGASIGSRQAPNYSMYRLYGQPATVPRTTTAALLDYHWLVGPSKRLYLATGAGVEATWRSRQARLDAGVPLARPTARLSLGIAF